MRKLKHFIGGEHFQNNDDVFDVINPKSNECVARAKNASFETINEAVVNSKQSQPAWASLSNRDRSNILFKIAALIDDNAHKFVELEFSEVGRTMSELTEVDIPETADCFRYFASAARMERGQVVQLPAPYSAQVVRQPYGVVAAITPWNFPLNIAAWKIAPALAAGNSVVLKPSELTPSSALLLAEIAVEAGLPAGVLNVITGFGETSGSDLTRHEGVDMIAFTGGQEAAKEIGKQVLGLNKVLSLELGGKSANILFEDASIDAAVDMAFEGIFFAGGQNCCAGSRLLVHESIFDDVVLALSKKLEAINYEDSDQSFGLGSMISNEHKDQVETYIDAAEQLGLNVIKGKAIPKHLDGGAYVRPCLILEPQQDYLGLNEEIFGPVLCVQKFKSDAEAVNMANSLSYDLAAGVWTNDMSRANRVSQQLTAGTVWINTYNRLFNDLGFGGSRKSGAGRDLGIEGLHHYSYEKSVCICYELGSDAWY